jgi:hypothetical protein
LLVAADTTVSRKIARRSADAKLQPGFVAIPDNGATEL